MRQAGRQEAHGAGSADSGLHGSLARKVELGHLPRCPCSTATDVRGATCGSARSAAGWIAIAWLGRLFTFDVAIVAGHDMIDTGPHRFMRKPPAMTP